MKKIVISMDNLHAAEVRENHEFFPRMGLNQLSFRAIVLQERKTAEWCEKIVEKAKFPPLIQKLNEFSEISQEVKEKMRELSFVLVKVNDLLKQGFHVMIITDMMGCACGHPSLLGHHEEFDVKFTRALIDASFRKDLWGTEHLLPIEMVRFFLIDLMNDVYPDDFRAYNIERSEIVRYYLSFRQGSAAHNLEAFIKFCQN